MSNADVLKSLKDGDLVKVTRTVKVDHWGGSIWGNDVSSGKSFLLDDSPTLKIEMVKKVAKQRTDYKVGDVVSGDELRATMWKRGTIISIGSIGTCDYVLQSDGLWVELAALLDRARFATSYSFNTFTNPSGFTIKYLPD